MRSQFWFLLCGWGSSLVLSFHLSPSGGLTPKRPALLNSSNKPSAEQPTSPARKRILSGVQPTGNLHLGNYLGAIRQWVQNQDEFDNFFFVVDLHAITVPHDTSRLAAETLQAAALYLACGVDPEKSKVFVQSHVKAHSELCWLLTTQAPIGWLENMIQFKEKSRKQGETIPTGLLTYPVLMAADILLYQAELVPVGEDQAQHLEFARDIRRRFHDLYCKKKKAKKVFKEPQVMLVKQGARVMSLLDGTSKMSKSEPNVKSRISLLDSPDAIVKKIKGSKTDCFEGIEYGNPDRPEATNLLNIFSAVSSRSVDSLVEEFGDKSWGQFKPALSEAVVEHLRPIQTRYKEFVSDPGELQRVLQDGAEAASAVADQTLHDAQLAMGFLSPQSLASESIRLPDVGEMQSATNSPKKKKGGGEKESKEEQDPRTQFPQETAGAIAGGPS
uniref:tryptophan--tRNA ligase n=1 Tax=Chromera velia CCMP2878 TaxID=1169474 RepID=A0A0G4G8M3_9ALVE|mmetsp:Transcript_39586/g.77947  ORF Transcript_39586/g.77947 Transcript_39586/m.77947 type:complete len:444 (+) Transcript_39586:73-1404(+)|eukprot:Cvel_20758.t1-p1 / transcript=Cvel_20758.t1 / gene=Cvel_20758 / organism=Chromera_velia_CCMP2878 / gene_product=Tryptophan--tRNA ligase, putative / transcript_product=Tryptophan--tRNA ligase, putative / location=Cvel_scaffold1892:11396-17115(-) / protein_length=443 / sequence_SO=supercontig / SO=protein_coding / is_pseudo=false